MGEAFIIEVSDIAVGLVVTERSGCRFFASGRLLLSIDGTVFKTPRMAEAAARRLLRERHGRAGIVVSELGGYAHA